MDISIPMQTRMKEDSSMIDLSLDYHAHILPGCDHGSSSVDMSLKQINMAKEAGVQTICATPHFYPHKESVSSFIERRRQTADILWAQIPTNAPRVLLGAEVLICDGMERLKAIHELCLEGTNELLLEMPFYRWPAPIWDTLYRLNDLRDIQIVIAHADRYPPEDIHQLISEGIPLQLNAECLRKHLHRKCYLEWIQKGYVSYLGSDIHEFGLKGAKTLVAACMHPVSNGMEVWTNTPKVLESRRKTLQLLLSNHDSPARRTRPAPGPGRRGR